GCGGLVVNANFIEKQDVARAVGPALQKHDVLELLGVKLVNRSRVKCGKGYANLNPAARGNVSGKPAERQSLREAPGELRHLKSFAGVRERNARKIGSSDRLGSKAPDEQAVAAQFRKAVAEVHELDFGLPIPFFHRLPFEAQRIRSSQKCAAVHGQL